MRFNKNAVIMIFVLCFSFVAAGQAWSSVQINSSNFPDNTFRKYVKENFDKDNDGTLTNKEINRAKVVDVSAHKIASLKGIEFLTALTELNCINNQLRESRHLSMGVA